MMHSAKEVNELGIIRKSKLGLAKSENNRNVGETGEMYHIL